MGRSVYTGQIVECIKAQVPSFSQQHPQSNEIILGIAELYISSPQRSLLQATREYLFEGLTREKAEQLVKENPIGILDQSFE